MFSMDRARTNQAGWPSARTVSRAFTHVAGPLRRAVPLLVQRLAPPVTDAVTRFTGRESNVASVYTSSGTPTRPESIRRDWLRQGLNLFLSVAQFAASAIIFSSQFGDELFRNPSAREPLIVPADYAFGIWGFIFPASIAYGVYQALPRQRANDLLRRIGFHTAFAFACITLWSVATLFDPLRYTVPLFFGALWALVYAVYQASNHSRPLTTAERVFVVVPLGVYAAWCTAGTIANTSTSLYGLGYTDPIFSEQTWAVVMLLAAGAISSFMTQASRGNIPYAFGVIWALIGIAAANFTERQNNLVALTAAAMAAIVGIVLVRVRVAAARAAQSRDV